MNDNQAIMKRAETLGGVRMVMLCVLVVSTLVMGACLIIRHEVKAVMPVDSLNMLRNAAQGLWFVCLIATVAINARIRRDAQLKNLIHDERDKMIRLRSFAAGFWVFMIAAVGSLLAALFIDLDLKSTLLLVLCLGATTPVFAQGLLARQP